MKTLELMKQSLKISWNNKKFWLFGLFVAGLPSSSEDDGGASSGPEIEGFPAWLIVLIIVGVLLCISIFIMNIISESALIDGFRQTHSNGLKPKDYKLKEGFVVGRKNFFNVLFAKALFFLFQWGTVGVVSLPSVLGVLGIFPLWLGIGLTIVIVPIAIPFFLTGYFIYEYALRFIVFDGQSAGRAVRTAKDYLHGKVSRSLEILGANIVGIFASVTVAMIVGVPCAAIALIPYYLGGSIIGIIVGSALFISFMLCNLGVLGSYRSGLWTLSMLEAQEQR